MRNFQLPSAPFSLTDWFWSSPFSFIYLSSFSSILNIDDKTAKEKSAEGSQKFLIHFNYFTAFCTFFFSVIFFHRPSKIDGKSHRLKVPIF
jgi:hypothetical protein